MRAVVEWDSSGRVAAMLMFYDDEGNMAGAEDLRVADAVVIEELQRIRRLLTPTEPALD